MAMRSKLLLAFYGDDFTGSTDAMEALAAVGVAHRAVPVAAETGASSNRSFRICAASA